MTGTCNPYGQTGCGGTLVTTLMPSWLRCADCGRLTGISKAFLKQGGDMTDETKAAIAKLRTAVAAQREVSFSPEEVQCLLLFVSSNRRHPATNAAPTPETGMTFTADVAARILRGVEAAEERDKERGETLTDEAAEQRRLGP